MSSVSSINSLLSSALSGSSTSTSSAVDLSSLLQAATGASSEGIDVTSAVDAALSADRAPEREWQAQQSTISSQVSALTTLQAALSAVSQDLSNLSDIDGSLASRTVSSSSTQISGSATAGATIGTHSVSVANLATSASWYSGPVPSAGSALGTSTLTISANGGAQTTFTTGSGIDSISDLANAINSASLGINASVVTDATGSRLALVSSTTGSAADFSVSYGASGSSSWSSASVASASTQLQAGSFRIVDSGSNTAITVNPGETLSGLADDINSQATGVSASVVTDSSGVHLQIASTDGSAVSLSADPTFNLTRASTATNASLTVDGIPVSSASNTVTGVVPGLTLNLTGTTAGTSSATVTVNADSNQISQTLSAFVSDYNSALSQVNSQFTYSTSTGSQGALSGDSIVRSLQGMLEGIVSYTAPAGAASGSTTIQSLSDLGITVNDDGSLALNTATLDSAVANPGAVQSLFQGTALNGFAQQFSTELSEFADPATGAIAQEIGNLNQQYSGLQSQISDYESGYIASQQTVLTAMYSKAEIALQQLPAEMQQIQSQLGNNSSKN
ncbi:MAG TPA: flagellar filament capping protein FliD [Acidobacteriaceae bacterium]|nr:flagellar filament capping protein FliD [Acidobacteriaceae bacterium]